MVRKKIKSKRLSLHDKYKVQRKVRQHHKKLRRSQRKNGTGRKKLRKDPGVPNMHPFKEDLLNKMAAKKARMDERAQRQKEQRAAELARRRKMTPKQRMQDLASRANSGARDYETQQAFKAKQALLRQNFVDFNDNSRRAYFKEFKKLVDSADVILEVLDARDPIGCRCPDIEKRILTEAPQKQIVYVLNKIDLVPPENVIAWLSYLRRFHPTVAFKCSTQKQKQKRKQSKVDATQATAAQRNSSECLGANLLLQLLKKYSISGGMKTMLTVGVIGYPNVGKSSLINSLKRERVAPSGPQAGVTTRTKEIRLDKNIVLMDCPGIVFAAGDADDIALRNVVKLDQIKNPISPIGTILKRCAPQQLQEHFGIPSFEGVVDFLALIAQRRGKVLSGGAPNLEAAARAVLQAWCEGSLAYHTEPPAVEDTRASTSVVSSFAPEFDIDALLETENDTIIQVLKPNNDSMLVTTAGAVPSALLDEDMGGEEEDPGMQDGLSKSAGTAFLRGAARKKVTSNEAFDFAADFFGDTTDMDTGDAQDDNSDSMEESDEEDSEEEDSDDFEVVDVMN